jgi:hypothetical protein
MFVGFAVAGEGADLNGALVGSARQLGDQRLHLSDGQLPRLDPFPQLENLLFGRGRAYLLLGGRQLKTLRALVRGRGRFQGPRDLGLLPIVDSVGGHQRQGADDERHAHQHHGGPL